MNFPTNENGAAPMQRPTPEHGGTDSMPLPTIPEIESIDASGLERSLANLRTLREEMGRKPLDFVAEWIHDAREDLMRAMKEADESGLTEAHRKVAELVLSIDDTLAWLCEGGEES